MGAVGSSADNALAESFNATLKRETLAGAAGWSTPAEARRAVFAWITRYNSRRRHSACGQTSPNDYEARRAPGYAANRGVDTDTPRVSKIKGQGPSGREVALRVGL